MAGHLQMQQLKDWFENHVELVTSKIMRKIVNNLEKPDEQRLGTDILDFIEN